MISVIINERKKKFADYGGDYISYSKATGEVIPNIIVIINGFELYNENYGDATFDMLKGIGILLVIIGHTFMKEIGPYIQAFHMPLFFMVAGYFFKYKAPKNLLTKDFRRLIVPYNRRCECGVQSGGYGAGGAG